MGLEVESPRVQLRAEGHAFAVRAPTLAELTAARSGDPVRGQRRLVAACVMAPAGEELAAVLRAKPGLFVALGPAILAAFGKDSQSLTILGEHEITDEAMAKAYVANAGSNKVHAVTYSRRSTHHALLLRDLRGPEVETLLASPSVESIRDLVVRATLWGDAKVIEHSAPALYLALADFLATQAGVAAEVEEGEFVG